MVSLLAEVGLGKIHTSCLDISSVRTLSLFGLALTCPELHSNALSYLILSNLFRARLQGCLDTGLETHTFSILVCTYLFESLSPIKKRHLKSYPQNTVPEIMAAVLRSGVQKLHVTLMIHRPNGSLLKWIFTSDSTSPLTSITLTDPLHFSFNDVT